MTENAVDPTMSATPAGPSTDTGERPAAPQGSVYLSDILARIRKHANDNNWCAEAEYVTTKALNDGLSFQPVRDLVVERFTPTEGTDPFVTKVRLKNAIRKAVDLCYDGEEHFALYRELVETYQLDEVPLAVLKYTVTFTVTDEHLAGQAVNEDGMAWALRYGITTGFTVTTEATELATPTLRP
ncbi:hypothetical protein [Actinoplanes sp. NPDC049316]|uniref:hypothetical protein n=1 Tax=Actinoplanes sp. NPDC049316 TaxID=3154727 RepID=UPI003442B46E